MKCCIPKGQGTASYSDEHFRNLRQSGDIDVWVDADIFSLKRVLSKLNV